MDKVSVIILNYNTSEMTHRSVAALLENEFSGELEVFVLDNGSSENLKSFSDKRVNLIRSEENLGFARGVNKAMENVSGAFILLLNSDVIVPRDFLNSVMNYFKSRSDCGIIGPMFNYPDKKFQTSSGLFPNSWREFMRFSTLWKLAPGGTLTPYSLFNRAYFSMPQNVDWVSGGCMMIRRELIYKIGALDPNFFFGVEDFDFCFRAKQAGWKVVYYPLVTVIHHHGFSSGGRRSTFSLKREAAGMDYFLNKNFPEKIFLRRLVAFLYKTKISILNLVFPSLKKK